MTWLTKDLPGTGGRYKVTPEDFQVEEIPLYDCAGSGEHLYLWIEKAGLSTRGLLQQLQRALHISEREIGYAGLKDANALTRQMISIPVAKSAGLDKLVLHKAKILRARQHTNKLRLGHLAGNRFTITLRDTVPDADQRAQPILEQLLRRGVPNFFGEQRYGILGNSARLGQLLLQHNWPAFCDELIGDPARIRNRQWQAAAQAYQAGQLAEALDSLPARMTDERSLLTMLVAGKTPQQAVNKLSKTLLRLLLSAAQSYFFDQLVQQRLHEPERLLDGDIAFKHVNGACFRVPNAAAEQPRSDSFEISPTAPLFGGKVMLAEGVPGQRESELLAGSGLTLADWNLRPGLSMPGERKPLRIPLYEMALEKGPDQALILRFALPKGSYATSVLREVTKTID